MDVFHLVLDDEAVDLMDFDIRDFAFADVPEFHIYSSSLLEGGQEDGFIAGLKHRISKMVDHYVQEKRYTIRLLLSSLVFLAVYFIGTFAIRDPFPILDELLIAAAVSVLFWRYMKKRDTRQMMAVDYKERLLKAVDGAVEEESLLLASIESMYADLKRLTPVGMAEKITSGMDAFTFPAGEEDAGRSFCGLFFKYIQKEEKSLASDMEDIKKGGFNPVSMQKRLLKAYGTGRYDIYLLALCLSL